MKQSGAIHAQIRRDIEARIMSGEWQPGERIPYEHQLMASYGCSRMTVNRALRALIDAGLLESRRRAGTIVSRPRIQRAALEIPDIRDEVAGQGEEYRLDLDRRDIRAATAEDRRLLQIDDGEVLALECRHHAGGRAFALERRLINLAAVPEAAGVDFAVEPPGSWLLAHVPWTEAEHRITAVNAGAKELVALGIAAGAACMALERWTWRGEERITYARQVYPGDRYALVARFRP
ncbi:MAG: histidine utilization repressor [Sphingopyxis sp.]|uniref:histidine utilization repressor n=1 Tax=Sphingopyxis sp. TaxID=1908224 RepID=UPI001A3E47B2|nr:histidine utilization repressor [Sphingopyxis sp.]MBL9069998.1 histidine utilization repressor [Sphingopyxis sp.]